MTDQRRALPSVSSLLESDGVRALLDRSPRSVVVDAIRRTIDAARAAPSSAPAERRAPGPTRSSAAVDAVDAAVAAPRHQRHRRRAPHEPRPRAARAGGDRRRRARRVRLLESRIRPRARRARLALRALRGAAARAHRRRGRAGRQQLRGGARARAQHVRRTDATPSSRAAS